MSKENCLKTLKKNTVILYTWWTNTWVRKTYSGSILSSVPLYTQHIQQLGCYCSKFTQKNTLYINQTHVATENMIFVLKFFFFKCLGNNCQFFRLHHYQRSYTPTHTQFFSHLLVKKILKPQLGWQF